LKIICWIIVNSKNMKNIIENAIFILIVGIFLTSCEQENEGNKNENENGFLVDEIYDNHYTLIGKFYYNNNNMLIKARWDTYYDEFIYKNNRVQEIKTTVTAPNYVGNTIINLYYDKQGRINKVGYNGAEPVNTYSYSTDGKLNLSGVEYDTNSNIVRFTQILKNPDPMMGDLEEFQWIGEYEYDNKLKPNFGIGDVFVYSPLFCYNSDIRIMNNLSKNNITKFIINGKIVDTYSYEYNEYNLPISIETKWEGIETTEPMIWKIKYKAISK
jgi:hypothetical protein